LKSFLASAALRVMDHDGTMKLARFCNAANGLPLNAVASDGGGCDRDSEEVRALSLLSSSRVAE